MVSTWRSVASRAVPRAIALVWAVWATWTVTLYIPPPPPQLTPLDELVPGSLWVLWAIPAVLLALGGLVPARAPESHKSVARGMRSVGLLIVTVLLVIWGTLYAGDDVIYSGHLSKNYFALGVAALASAWFIGRETASPRYTEEEVTDYPDMD